MLGATAPGNLQEMQVLKLQPRPIASEISKVSLTIGGLSNISEDFHVPGGFRTIVWYISSSVMGEYYQLLSLYIYVCMDWIYLCIDSCGFFWRGLAILFRFLCNWNLIDIYKGISYPDKTFRTGNMAFIQVTKIKHRQRNRKITRKKISLNWWNYFLFVYYLWTYISYELQIDISLRWKHCMSGPAIYT